MLAKKVRDLGLDRLGQQSTRPIAQDFGELIRRRNRSMSM
jgi:hypothetical protein